MRKTTSLVVGLASVVLAGACGGETASSRGEEPTPSQGSDGDAQVPLPEANTLRRMQSCDDLTQAIKADALRKMNDTVDAQIESLRTQAIGQFGGGDVATGAERGGVDAAPASAGAAPPSGGSGAAEQAKEYSQTNTQVAGVDEADIVKNDGKYIYLLHGSSFQIVTAWPAPSLAAANKVDIEGRPGEMFVANGKAVVFSAVNGEAVYRAAGVQPRSRYREMSGAGSSPPCRDGYSCNVPVTKVTVLGVNGTDARVERELYFEGSYTSSRRVDAHVRVVLRAQGYGPQLKTYPDRRREPQAPPLTLDDNIAAWEQLRAANTAAIQGTTFEAWAPYTFTKTEGVLRGAPTACESFFVPSEATTAYGVTQIASFQLDRADEPRSVAVLGAVDTVYSSNDAMVLAARAWINPKKALVRPAGRKAPFVDFLPSTATYLHKFDLKADPAAPTYTASGAIPGHLLNQFAIDERDGVVRVATTEQRSVRTWIGDDPKSRPFVNQFSVNRVLTVKTAGDALKVVGDVGDLAPGERIFSARFVGDKGYVVTFRQVDPLFVIDLAQPEQPKVLAALKIPGFSEYMHPLDEGHLLTIGRDATETGARRGLAIQIFDVTQPTAPRLMHRHVYDDSIYGMSEAEQNHKAFTYFAARKMLAFPFYGYGGGGSGFRSSAELFSIDLDKGIQKVGSVEHTSLFGTYTRGYCGGYYSPQVRRTVFLEDVLYSISYGGVIASDTKALAGPAIATLPLTSPLAEGLTCR